MSDNKVDSMKVGAPKAVPRQSSRPDVSQRSAQQESSHSSSNGDNPDERNSVVAQPGLESAPVASLIGSGPVHRESAPVPHLSADVLSEEMSPKAEGEDAVLAAYARFQAAEQDAAAAVEKKRAAQADLALAKKSAEEAAAAKSKTEVSDKKDDSADGDDSEASA